MEGKEKEVDSLPGREAACVPVDVTPMIQAETAANDGEGVSLPSPSNYLLDKTESNNFTGQTKRERINLCAVLFLRLP